MAGRPKCNNMIKVRISLLVSGFIRLPEQTQCVPCIRAFRPYVDFYNVQAAGFFRGQIQIELLVAESLVAIGHVNAAHFLLAEFFKREEVEHVVNVAYGVDMAVNVNVAAKGRDATARLGGTASDACRLRYSDIRPVYFEQGHGRMLLLQLLKTDGAA